MQFNMSRDTELRLLGDLCRALARRGVCVQMRDAIPGLTIARPGGTALEVIGYVVISKTKGQFSWWRVDNLHPVSDVDGAAEQITAFIADPTPRQPSS
ncbi:hypothetical protein [Actinomadura fibrosa]|uniref:Uncharacterized protein n=1 Tax=Actinomadura fibrosa TaxID=111802 RepID=A0ABW2XU75_9ACTN|nr:hypothetical protein [Actinomadura fibrosa]